MYKVFLFILLALVFSNCKFVLKKVYGITQPKLEDDVSLNNFLRKLKIKDEPIYTFKNIDTLYKFYSKASIPEAFFFNQQGFFVDYRETPTSCNAGIKNFIADLKNRSQDRLDTNKIIHNHTIRLVDKNKQTVVFEQLPKTEFYVVMYWAKFIGKTNNKILDWQKAIAEARKKGLSITTIYVSCDYQKSWGIVKKDIPKFKY